MLYEMLEGIPPYYDHSRETLMKNIVSKQLEVSDDLTDDVVDLLEKLLIKDPAKRLGSKGAEEVKSHPWF